MSTAAGSIRCHDAGSTGGVPLVFCVLFWALGEHKAKARHHLALFFALYSRARARVPCSGGNIVLHCSAALDNGAADTQVGWQAGQSDRLTSDD